ncbi:hypothetical protein L3Q82_023599 [Scortum barcoo]|uniref:Uncharacterized protein n=1 Tax=Scortum barcoo TaxID=214431 RepID=A0ACB8WUN2_9TELE|nr:hypothetical protein L3Q82_023599 [Scortum barcoo]
MAALLVGRRRLSGSSCLEGRWKTLTPWEARAFFFSLERRNGQRKVIHCLRSSANGSSLTETTEIRRRAVITLLPKKGDLQDPEELETGLFALHGDYKVLSKALALRLREAMAEVVHVDQTYCVPGRLHWLPQAVLFLPKEEGGQGLVHLASRGAAFFRLQFIQRLLLYGPQDLVWRPLAQLTLRSIGGLGLQQSVFLMDFKAVNLLSLPVFYRGLFSVWKLLRRQRVRHESLFWLLQEPMAHGRPHECPLLGRGSSREGPQDCRDFYSRGLDGARWAGPTGDSGVGSWSGVEIAEEASVDCWITGEPV